MSVFDMLSIVNQKPSGIAHHNNIREEVYSCSVEELQRLVNSICYNRTKFNYNRQDINNLLNRYFYKNSL